MKRGLRTVWTYGGRSIPPLQIRGKPGDVWPTAGYLRLDTVSEGWPSQRVKAYVDSAVAVVEARPVVSGTPGSWVDVTAGALDVSGYAAGATITVDFRATLEARAGGYVERNAEFRVVADEPGGWG